MKATYNATAALCLLSLVSACSSTEELGSEAINDPYETTNRAIHSFNKGADKVVLRPVSRTYGALVPDPVQIGVGNAVSNLGVPSDVINHGLQGDPVAAVQQTGRFLLNSTFGVAGLLDPATKLGLPAEPTDFGETLHVWGTGEGAYVELPFLGPSTTRDATGRVVDALTDPLQLLANDSQQNVILSGTALGLVDQRHRLRDVIEPVYDDSADSYAAARIGYLQNRRRTLKGETDADDLEDPFAFDE